MKYEIQEATPNMYAKYILDRDLPKISAMTFLDNITKPQELCYKVVGTFDKKLLIPTEVIK